ncbi:CDGSH iron-sulfur domain-containing protein [Rhodoferax sp. WC2427]
MKYSVTTSHEVYLCDCKESAYKPLCDGSHNQRV